MNYTDLNRLFAQARNDFQAYRKAHAALPDEERAVIARRHREARKAAKMRALFTPKETAHD